MHLRGDEWINLVAFCWFLFLAWMPRRLALARRIRITAIGAAGLAITLFASLALPHLVPSRAAGIGRDWVPMLLLTLLYWQAGQFVTGADRDFEQRLERLDLRLVAPALQWCARSPAGGWIFAYLELSYWSYFPLVPAAIAALYLLGKPGLVDLLWTAILLGAYPSCGTLPFLPMRPPRALGEKWTAGLPSGTMRAFNEWILHRGSIQANTYPSVHVVIATACALVMLDTAPWWLGLAFCWVAVSIALGAVGGRYHYAADAILGVLVGAAGFLAGIGLAALGFLADSPRRGG